ncbi:CCD33 protein, partial [Piprites chloris]|nr:CCD33 protein [Piprites chloris]
AGEPHIPLSLQRSRLKAEEKTLDFEFEVVSAQFNRRGCYALRLTVENPLLQGSGAGIQLRVNGGNAARSSTSTTDTVEQSRLNQIYSFQRRKFTFTLPRGFCKNDKNHDVRLHIEALRFPGRTERLRRGRRVGEAFFAIYPRPDQPRLKLSARSNEDWYRYSAAVALLRVGSEQPAMHCGRLAFTASLHEHRPPPTLAAPPPRPPSSQEDQQAAGTAPATPDPGIPPRSPRTPESAYHSLPAEGHAHFPEVGEPRFGGPGSKQVSASTSPHQGTAQTQPPHQCRNHSHFTPQWCWEEGASFWRSPWQLNLIASPQGGLFPASHVSCSEHAAQSRDLVLSGYKELQPLRNKHMGLHTVCISPLDSGLLECRGIREQGETQLGLPVRSTAHPRRAKSAQTWEAPTGLKNRTNLLLTLCFIPFDSPWNYSDLDSFNRDRGDTEKGFGSCHPLREPQGMGEPLWHHLGVQVSDGHGAAGDTGGQPEHPWCHRALPRHSARWSGCGPTHPKPCHRSSGTAWRSILSLIPASGPPPSCSQTLQQPPLASPELPTTAALSPGKAASQPSCTPIPPSTLNRLLSPMETSLAKVLPVFHSVPPCSADPRRPLEIARSCSALGWQEVGSYRLALRRMAGDLLSLRRHVTSLEVENGQLRCSLASQQELGHALLHDADLDVMTREELQDRLASTAEMRRLKDRVQQLQNELIRKNDREKELVLLQRAHRLQQAMLRRCQDKVAKAKGLEQTVQQQEKVIEVMERVLQEKLAGAGRSTEKPAGHVPVSPPPPAPGEAFSGEVHTALLAENRRLREELARAAHPAAPIAPRPPALPGVWGGTEKLSLLARLEEAQARGRALERQLEKAARKWGREKQELGTRLLEQENGF